jgi:hypothetical protein
MVGWMLTEARVRLPIIYGGFWDYPLTFAVFYEGLWIVFERAFSEALDEFESDFRVWTVPGIRCVNVAQAGERLVLAEWDEPTTCLGTVSLDRIVFDGTRRKEIGSSILDEILSCSEMHPTKAIQPTVAGTDALDTEG